jgi:predicted ester cyclase
MRCKVAMAMVVVLTAAALGRAGEAPMDPKRVVAGLYAAITAHNYDNMGKYLQADFLDHNPQPGQAAGANGAMHAFEELYKSFPDLKLQMQQVVAEGDWVTARVFAVGTHKGTWMGIAATGKPFRIGGIDMLKVKNGQVVERWGFFDFMSLQQQLAPAKK